MPSRVAYGEGSPAGDPEHSAIVGHIGGRFGQNDGLHGGVGNGRDRRRRRGGGGGRRCLSWGLSGGFSGGHSGSLSRGVGGAAAR